MDVTADLLNHEDVEFVYEFSLFKRSDELCRRKKSIFRIYPARQRLKAAKLASERSDNGLIIDFDPTFGDRIVYPVDYVLFQHPTVPQLFNTLIIPTSRGESKNI